MTAGIHTLYAGAAVWPRTYDKAEDLPPKLTGITCIARAPNIQELARGVMKVYIKRNDASWSKRNDGIWGSWGSWRLNLGSWNSGELKRGAMLTNAEKAVANAEAARAKKQAEKHAERAEAKVAKPAANAKRAAAHAETKRAAAHAAAQRAEKNAERAEANAERAEANAERTAAHAKRAAANAEAKREAANAARSTIGPEDCAVMWRANRHSCGKCIRQGDQSLIVVTKELFNSIFPKGDIRGVILSQVSLQAKDVNKSYARVTQPQDQLSDCESVESHSESKDGQESASSGKQESLLGTEKFAQMFPNFAGGAGAGAGEPSVQAQLPLGKDLGFSLSGLTGNWAACMDAAEGASSDEDKSSDLSDSSYLSTSSNGSSDVYQEGQPSSGSSSSSDLRTSSSGSSSESDEKDAAAAAAPRHKAD